MGVKITILQPYKTLTRAERRKWDRLFREVNSQIDLLERAMEQAALGTRHAETAAEYDKRYRWAYSALEAQWRLIARHYSQNPWFRINENYFEETYKPIK